MIYNQLGRSGLQVSAIGFGNMLNYKPEDEEVNVAIIRKCIESGVNFFDTAEMYAGGQCEEALGRALKVIQVPRCNLVISTKLFSNWAPGQQVNRVNTLSRKHLLEGMDASLQRIQLSYVDIVFAHRYDDLQTEMEEICRAFNQIIESGKAFYWGTSEWDSCTIMEAHNVCDRLGLIHPIAEQCQYNMLTRNAVEKDLVHLFEKHGTGTTVWSPLAGGQLTGKYNHGIPEDSRLNVGIAYFPKAATDHLFGGGKDPKQVAKFQALGEIAKQQGCTQSQLALAWVIHNKDVSTSIIGGRTLAQVTDCLEAVKVKISAEVLAQIEEVLNNKPTQNFHWRKFQSKDSRR